MFDTDAQEENYLQADRDRYREALEGLTAAASRWLSALDRLASRSYPGTADTMSVSSVLSDATIRRLVEDGTITIDPWDPGLLQPASVDLRLGDRKSTRLNSSHLG